MGGIQNCGGWKYLGVHLGVDGNSKTFEGPTCKYVDRIKDITTLMFEDEMVFEELEEEILD